MHCQKFTLSALILSAIYLLPSSVSADDFVPENEFETQANVFILGSSNDAGDVTLQFGDTLNESFGWDSANTNFVLSDNLDIENNQLINVRVENLASAPTCDASIIGRLYFNTTDTRSYVCDGTDWINQTAGSTEEVVATVKSYTDGLRTDLVANGGVEGGNAGKATLFVLNTTDGKAQITSLEDGNVVQAFLTGDDFANNIPQETTFLKKGEIYIFESLQNGSVISSTEGAYGYSGQRIGNDESPMPLGSLAFSFTDTFFFAFRNSTNAANDLGLVYVANGAVESNVSFRFGNGTLVDGQADVTLAPYASHIFHTDGNTEYRIQSDNPIIAGVNAEMNTLDGQTGRFWDSRLIMPLMNDGMTWPRSGNMSALFNNTQVDFWVRDGAEGEMNSTAGTGISPGTPIDMDAAIGVGTGAADADYEPNGATRFKATGLISGYSGADSAGLEASPMWPTSSFVQRAALPLAIRNAGDGGNNGIAITSPYEGTAEVYEWDPIAEVANLVYTVPLTRNIGGTTTRDDQNHPASALVSANAGESTVQLTGDFYGGYVEADVPFHCVFNSEQNQNGATTVTRKGTSGAAVIAINADDDEQATTGITPNDIRNETRTDANGLLRKRVIDGSGAETWVIE